MLTDCQRRIDGRKYFALLGLTTYTHRDIFRPLLGPPEALVQLPTEIRGQLLESPPHHAIDAVDGGGANQQRERP